MQHHLFPLGSCITNKPIDPSFLLIWKWLLARMTQQLPSSILNSPSLETCQCSKPFALIAEPD
eukprot:m.183403 g.183403  ORF g.183403 m.183403 type:complete len:63 (-) comp15543_c0_seq4:847-1035(-)